MNNVNNQYESILELSEDFNRPALIPNILEDGYITENDINQLFININKYREIKPSLRVYVNDSTRDLYVNLVLSNPPQESDGIEEWCDNLFANNKYCVILNHAETWNDVLVEKISRLLSPTLGNFGYNEFEHEIMLFIGNYNYTPFGIHIDGKGDTSFQFNVIGKTRNAYLWHPENYSKLTGKKRTPYYFPDRLVDTADFEIELPQNDLFILPASKYFHIYSNNGFNVSIAYFLKKTPKSDILSSAIRLKEKEVLSNIETHFDLDDFSKNEPIIPAVNKDITSLSDSLSLKSKVKEVEYLRNSNNGFISDIIEKDDEIDFSVDSLLTILKPFKILYYADGKKMNVFCRGKKIVYSDEPWLKIVIDHINSSKITLKNLESKVLASDIEKVHSFLQNIYQYRCLEVLPGRQTQVS